MRAETLQKLVGRPVRDIYGRFIGSIVGLSFDTSGQPKTIGVDHGSGNFAEYPNTRIIFDNDAIVLVPSWRLDTDKLRREITATQKRMQALEELVREGEVAQVAYDELCKQYNAHIRELQSAYSSLISGLKERIDYLETRRESLEKFLGNIKVQYRTGEIDESTYRVANQYVTTMLQKDAKEKEDILTILGSLGFPGAQAEEPITVQVGEEPPAASA